MVKVSIIIVNFNTKLLLDQCISSIYEQCRSNNYEIIVVDNCSNDGSIDFIRSKYNNVKVIKNFKNYGFGKANNIGVKYSLGKYLLLLNSDTIVKNNIIDKFINFYENNNLNLKIGCLGAWLYDENENLATSMGSFPSKKGLIKDYLNMIIYKNKYTNVNDSETEKKPEYMEVDYLTGALLFMEKNTFNKFNGFDETFFMYYEETDLQYRMKLEGLKRIILTSPKVIHLEGRSPNLSNQKRIIYTESMYKFFKKRTSKFKYNIFKILTLSLRLATFLKRQYTFKENISFLYKMIKI